ncbi:MAG TPA: phosphatase PAP2 family protein [Nocardioides sp.]|nr:phosphatase PAP2 family protein [Nocardioides sp.]
MFDLTVLWGPTQEGWFRDVNRFAIHTGWLHTPARLFAQYGVAVFAALLLVSWLLARRTGEPRRVAAALWGPFGVLVAVGLNQPISNAVAEARPYTVFPHALTLVARSTDFSFPSDHSVMAGAAAVGVLLANRRLGLVTAALAVLMAVTRVYVGAHWPLDVVAGLAIGAGFALAAYAIVRPLLVRIVERLGSTPLRALVR